MGTPIKLDFPLLTLEETGARLGVSEAEQKEILAILHRQESQPSRPGQGGRRRAVIKENSPNSRTKKPR